MQNKRIRWLGNRFGLDGNCFVLVALVKLLFALLNHSFERPRVVSGLVTLEFIFAVLEPRDKSVQTDCFPTKPEGSLNLVKIILKLICSTFPADKHVGIYAHP